MPNFVKEFHSYYNDSTNDSVDNMINKWLKLHPACTLVDVKIDCHYASGAMAIHSIITYESDNPAYIDWTVGVEDE